MQQQINPVNNMKLDVQCSTVQQNKVASTPNSVATRHKPSTVLKDYDKSVKTQQVPSEYWMRKQYRSLYWPLQMGQPIKSPNFDQQQCKCNKRQLGEESNLLPSIQMR